MLENLEPGGSLCWTGPDEKYLYRLFVNEQQDILFKRTGQAPTPLELIEVGLNSRMGLLCHGKAPRLCRNIVCLEPMDFPKGASFTAPDFAAGALRTLYVLGTNERKVKNLGTREVISIVMGDEETIGYDFDSLSGILLWTNNWQLKGGHPDTCEVNLEMADIPLSQMDFVTKPLISPTTMELPGTQPPNPDDKVPAFEEKTPAQMEPSKQTKVPKQEGQPPVRPKVRLKEPATHGERPMGAPPRQSMHRFNGRPEGDRQPQRALSLVPGQQPTTAPARRRASKVPVKNPNPGLESDLVEESNTLTEVEKRGLIPRIMSLRKGG